MEEHVPRDLDEAFELVEFRFLNIPQEEIETPERLFFQLEQAHWYYEDYLADRYKWIQHFKKFEQFCRQMYSRCDVLKPMQDSFDEQFNQFRDYRATIPVYGGILLNEDMTKVLLVQGWQQKSWGFPKGKVNQAEDEVKCAAREVFEEIGYDMTPLVDRNAFVEFNSKQGRKIKLFIVKGVDMDFEFAPQVRKEIQSIRWFDVSTLPTNHSQDSQDNNNTFWMVHVFTSQILRYIRKQRGESVSRPKSRPRDQNNEDNATPTRRPNSRPNNGKSTASTQKSQGKSKKGVSSDTKKPSEKPPSKSYFTIDRDMVLQAMAPFLSVSSF